MDEKIINRKYPTKRLKFVVTINDDTLTDETDPDFEINYIDIGNVDSTGKINEIINYKFSEAPSRARRKVKHKDVIISTVRTYLRAIASIDFEMENLIVSTGFAVIRPKRNVFDPNFCKYSLIESNFIDEVQKRSVGVSYPAINASDLGDIYLPIPSLEQQNKIVHYLDREIAKIDALIEKKTKLIALLEEKKKAVINQAVTKGLDTTVAMKDSGIEWLGEIPEHWEVVKLKYLVNKIDELNYADVEYKIAVENIVGFSGKLTNLESFNYEGITTKFKKNDIIFNKLRPYLGKVYLAKEEGGVYGELLVLRPNEKLVSKFLFYVMISTNFINLVNSSTTGAKMPRASWEDFIKHIDIPLISIDEQQNITDFLEIMLTKNEKLSNRLLSSIELLKEKRTTIISAAINGEINLD
ncbi:EcoKI restriction-modification system protein HsdS [Flavobacterium columnare]|uniref:Restriction endonuclease subunit S n=2 Tax=Flavobacterium TaxID=237 RepID=A0ABW8PS50_9FLAO|nr:restriction endonuclease subunit S [Flavobacterium columnare]SPE76712.1 EcoKI restriction-modification system protein HsdS [Flavobacterium columnare]